MSATPEPVDFKQAKSQLVFGFIFWTFMAMCGGGVLAFGLVMTVYPQLSSQTTSDRLWSLAGIPMGGWMTWMSIPWLRRVAAGFKRTTPVVRLDGTGMTIDTGRGSKCFFPWAENPSFELDGDPGAERLTVSNAGVSAEVKAFDVAAPVKDIHRQAKIFQTAYAADA